MIQALRRAGGVVVLLIVAVAQRLLRGRAPSVGRWLTGINTGFDSAARTLDPHPGGSSAHASQTPGPALVLRNT